MRTKLCLLGEPEVKPDRHRHMTSPSPKLFLSLLFLFGFLAAACGAAEVSVSSDDSGEFPVDPDDTASGDDDPVDGEGPGDDDVILGAGPYAVGTLKIVIEHPNAETLSYELACFGDTATLIPDPTDGVRADRACTALADAAIEQYLTEGSDPGEVCTEIYGGPDTALIVGMLNGKDVDLTVDRSNGCGIDRWDVLLADVLPAALGNV